MKALIIKTVHIEAFPDSGGSERQGVVWYSFNISVILEKYTFLNPGL